MAAVAAAVGGGAPVAIFNSVLRDPKARDPRGFILPADQPDFLTATKFINTLIKAGVVAHRATAPFTVGGKQYPAGSFVVKAAQAFRAHVMDMFEPQDHPDDIPYPGGPPRPPYDVTGYNIAYSMGIKFDRILEGFDGPFEKVADIVAVAPGKIAPATSETQTTGYLLSHEVNDAFVAVNRLLKANEEVHWLKSPWTVDGKTFPIGAMYIPAKPTTLPILQKLAAEKGLDFGTIASRPADTLKLKPVRIGLWDQYGGSMPSGWTRWIFEQYQFPFEVVYPRDARRRQPEREVRRARLRRRRHPRTGCPAEGGGGFGGAQPAASAIPAEFRGWLGRVTVAKTVPEIKKFVENGGTVLTIGSSTALGHHLGLPIRNALVERTAGGVERPLPREKFYIPGTILEARIDRDPSARVRDGGDGDGDVGREPGVPAPGGGGAQGREAGRVVRQCDAAAQRLGVGPAVPRSGGRHRRRAARQRPRRAVRAGSALARAAARHVQAVLQRHLLRQRHFGAGWRATDGPAIENW